MADLRAHELWFVTGSQSLYGEAALRQVGANARTVADGLAAAREIPVRVVGKPVVTTPEAITAVCREANAAPACAGLIFWMHTFSPAKMWIAGLTALDKPWAHLHTQFNRDLPWGTIDMDFMNLNQSAHGDREFGFIGTRLRLDRTVIVGHWQDPAVRARLGVWARAAAARADARGLKVARLGDNMREVAVTEGDKVEAQAQFGYAVNGYGVGELVALMAAVGDREIERLCAEYDATYAVAAPLRKNGQKRASLRDAARIELGLKAFLERGGFKALTTTFEDLHGLSQLPGLAIQRLMAAGYGFGAEGDWKTAALVRAMKVMGTGLAGGASFMEDYTYDFDPKGPKVLGAHMLEVCESIAKGKPSLEMHPLGIGGKADPPRLVFDVARGPALNATVLDMGNRFRMILNEVDVVASPKPLKKLPVARAVWVPRPDLKTAAAAWILAGGAHHTGFSQCLTREHLEDFALMSGIEVVTIDKGTTIPAFRNELRWNDVAWD
ncbi:MAG: L-arabinose isomerase [Candidatus Coatesbacteria bacterium]